jgi:hypothetical protein
MKMILTSKYDSRLPGCLRALRSLSIIVGFFFLLETTSYSQPFALLSYSEIPDVANQTVSFSLTFNRVPDFNTYDNYGRQADEFVIDILNNPGPVNELPSYYVGDIRIVSGWQQFWSGSPTNFTGYFATATPQRTGTQFIEKLPFQQTGATVSFVTTFSQLDETDGIFEAYLQTAVYGSEGLGSGQHLYPTPEPSATLLLLLGLSAFGAGRKFIWLRKQ